MRVRRWDPSGRAAWERGGVAEARFKQDGSPARGPRWGEKVANLKWKTPRSKTRSRRAANWKLGAVTTVECAQCHQPKRPHFVCGHCGTYDGRQVVEVRDEHAGHDHD